MGLIHCVCESDETSTVCVHVKTRDTCQMIEEEKKGRKREPLLPFDFERRGCGQGIGAINKVQSAGELVNQMLVEYAAAKER